MGFKGRLSSRRLCHFYARMPHKKHDALNENPPERLPSPQCRKDFYDFLRRLLARRGMPRIE